MIKKILFSSLIAFGAVAYFSLETQKAQTFAANPPDGRTGAPGELDCTGCHTGTPVVGSEITHNIPNSGYIAGQTYTVTVNSSGIGVTKFGFQITAMDASDVKVGEFLDNNDIGVSGNGAYAEHVGSNNTGNDSKSWTFDWVAPVSGTGDVTFYAATNACNNNAATSGDLVTLSSSLVSEDASLVSIEEVNLALKVKAFPQPLNAGESLNLNFSKSGIMSVNITDIQGKIVKRISNEAVNKNQPYLLNLNDLTKGIYLLTGTVNDWSFSQKMIIQ